MTHKGTCFRGAIGVETEGEPQAMGYCHCGSCRSWSASPVNAFSLWKPEQVKVTRGEAHLAGYNKTPFSARMYCDQCGGLRRPAAPSKPLRRGARRW